MSKKSSKKSKAEQLKIAGTGCTDMVPELENQAEAFREAKEAREGYQEEEEAEQMKLTELLKKHKLTSYVYEDAEGTKREVYIPLEAKAKTRKLKAKAPETDAE